MIIWRRLLSTLFSFSLLGYLVLFLIENIVPGFVTDVYPLTIFLYPIVGFGIASAILPVPDDDITKVVEPSIRMPKFKLWKILLLVCALIAGYILYMPRPDDKISRIENEKRLAPQRYSITLLNHSNNPSYLASYDKLLKSKGYVNTDTKSRDDYPKITNTTVLFQESDRLVGEEIASILRESYDIVQTLPLLTKKEREIVIILGETQL